MSSNPSKTRKIILVVLLVIVIIETFILFSSLSHGHTTTVTTKTYRINPMCVSSHLNGLSNSDLNTQLNLMKKAGIKWTRFDFTMDVIEPSQDNFNWTSYDNIVNTAALYGVNIIALVDQYFTPNWANNTLDNMVPPPPAIYQSYAQAIAAHYSGKISLFEMGNEPNETGSWHPQWNAAAYTALLKAGYNGVKAGNPNAKVLSGGLSNESTTSNSQSATISFIQQMYANGAKGYFDYFAFHPYSQPKSPDVLSQNSTTFNVLSTIKTLMEQEGDKNKQIIITEFGWPTTSDFSGGGVTRASQAAYISRVYAKIMHQDYQYVSIACVYDFKDDSTNTTNDQDNFGVLNADYTQKPSFTSIQKAASDFSSNFTEISP